jgi:hypothetical protein
VGEACGQLAGHRCWCGAASVEARLAAPLWGLAVPWNRGHLRWQSGDFYRKFARAFEDIARDIEDGQEPDPHNMAEEIALHLMLDAAAGIVADEAPELELFTGGMPKSRFDFDFDLLHDVLYQDKDYEIAFLSNPSIAKPDDLEEWFEDFQTPAPRDPGRGFHR